MHRKTNAAITLVLVVAASCCACSSSDDTIPQQPLPEAGAEAAAEAGVDATQEAVSEAAAEAAKEESGSDSPGEAQQDALKDALEEPVSDAASEPEAFAETCSTVADLINQTGCGPGRACDIVSSQGKIGCRQAGTKAPFESCNGGTQCAAGTVCAGNPPACLPYCDSVEKTGCPDKSACGGEVTTASGNVGLCVETDDCDLLTGGGCEAGEACYLLVGKTGQTKCAPVGTKTEGESCVHANDCIAGNYCLGTCSRWCKEGTACPANQVCKAIGQVANHPDLGLCG